MIVRPEDPFPNKLVPDGVEVVQNCSWKPLLAENSSTHAKFGELENSLWVPDFRAP